ncbi:MAG: hypothetical protein HY912_22050 [Desulfomonile tiedjei]|uniref:Uncharacterized protein n=1 Tax=Desulfomonile tiedjei TaxID=2358 RepID=A0A9D6V4Z3_9BACT|nr:hypothetical protein [Desulfomonile tiedjei]
MNDRKLTTDEAARIVESFDNLPVQRRVEIIGDLSAEALEQLISVSRRASEIMRRISEEEVFFTIKELGEESAPALIAMTTGRQLQYVLDVELWKKDMLDLRAAGRWLEFIAASGDDKIIQFVQVTDSELLFAILGRLLRVRLRDPEVDLTEQMDSLPQFTLDDLFFVEFRTPDSEEAIKRILEAIFRWHTEYYMTLMEHLSWDNHMEHEETARKWRNSRLAEKGFPEFDEVLEIYQYINKGQLVGPLSSPPPERDAEEPCPMVKFPLKVLDSDNLFRRSLDRISTAEERDRLCAELAHLGNKVMIADGKDPGSAEEIRASLMKVGAYINMALEDVCEEDVATAAALLKSNHMELLFRRGFSLILELRKDVQRFVRDYEGGAENLGSPLASLVNGLLQKRPIYAGNVFENQKARDFEFLEDIATIRKLMDRSALEDKWEPV